MEVIQLSIIINRIRKTKYEWIVDDDENEKTLTAKTP